MHTHTSLQVSSALPCPLIPTGDSVGRGDGPCNAYARAHMCICTCTCTWATPSFLQETQLAEATAARETALSEANAMYDDLLTETKAAHEAAMAEMVTS